MLPGVHEFLLLEYNFLTNLLLELFPGIILWEMSFYNLL